MRDLRGETTVFYSTHILDDVERVSDHVAILDGGRLVKSAPTGELLASFDQDRLRVALGGADDSTRWIALTSLPGVIFVEPAERTADLRTYLVRCRSPAPPSRRHHPLRRRERTDRRREPARPPRAGRRVPPPRQHQGACR